MSVQLLDYKPCDHENKILIFRCYSRLSYMIHRLLLIEPPDILLYFLAFLLKVCSTLNSHTKKLGVQVHQSRKFDDP